MKHKKLFIAFLITFIVTACSQKQKTIKITDFSKVYTDTLRPKKDASYASSVLEAKGYVNDTVTISLYGIERKFKGNIDIRLFMDYYGTSDVYFIFDPMNATEGEIEIQYGIY